jgi:hypothetical protein
MGNRKLLKTAIIGVGSFIIFLSTAILTGNHSVHAASVQAVNVQAVSGSASLQKADRIIAKAKSLIGKV